MMKAVYLSGLRQFESKDVSEPRIVNESDVLVRIRTVGVCGSDIHYYTSGRIGNQRVRFPFVIGHEAAGIVEKTGKSVTRVKPGESIAIDPALSCGECDQCRAGRENTCRKLLFLGTPGQLEGCLRQYVILHEKCCYPVDKSMTFDEATLTEPLSIAIHAVEKASLSRETRVGILGLGPIGMSVFHVVRTKDVDQVYVTDRIEERIAFSQQLHPFWGGNPDRVDVVSEISSREPQLLDVVYECSGDPAAMWQAAELLKPGGSIVIVGIPEPDAVPFPVHEWRRRELTIFNVRRQSHATQKAIDMLARHVVNLDPMVTHRFPLEKTQEAFELVANYKDGVMKAMIALD
jgi:L-iditol 2-dehydrogenase